MSTLLRVFESHAISTAALLAVLGALQVRVMAQELTYPSSFSIYCSSNFDGTGRCVRDSDANPITCVMIPGAVISCRDKARRIYECVQYGSIVASQTQTQFVCKPDARQTSNDQPLIEPTPAASTPDATDPDIGAPHTAAAGARPAPGTSASPRTLQPPQPSLLDPFGGSRTAPPATVLPNGF
jgi:hypothetical protein